MSIDIMISVRVHDAEPQRFMYQHENEVHNQRSEFVFDVLAERARESLLKMAGHNQIKCSGMACRSVEVHEAHRWNSDVVVYGPYWCNGVSAPSGTTGSEQP